MAPKLRSELRGPRIDLARQVIRDEKPRDPRRETVWQYQDRLAAAVVDALFAERGCGS